VIYPSRKDQLTPGTERQIAGNNAANVAWCGQRQPPGDVVEPAPKPKAAT